MRTASSSSEGATEQGGAGDKLLQLFMGDDQDLAAGNLFVEARIRAAFYPKFENDKSDQQVRGRLPLPCTCLLDCCSLLPPPCGKQCQLFPEQLLGVFPSMVILVVLII
jgi:hypothetical protein